VRLRIRSDGIHEGRALPLPKNSPYHATDRVKTVMNQKIKTKQAKYMNQNKIFLEGEGDLWFNRNRSKIAEGDAACEPDVRFIIDTLLPFRDEIRMILKIGCSNGWKIKSLAKSFDAIGCGIDPSASAIASGNSGTEKSKIKLSQGSSHRLPYQDNEFDLVYFGFCLYLCDRSQLLQSIAEADRVLRPGGFVVVTDFDPGSARKRSFLSKPGLFSFKQDYSRIFIESNGYYLVEKHSFSHTVASFDNKPNERVSTQILYKEMDSYIES